MSGQVLAGKRNLTVSSSPQGRPGLCFVSLVLSIPGIKAHSIPVRLVSSYSPQLQDFVLLKKGSNPYQTPNTQILTNTHTLTHTHTNTHSHAHTHTHLPLTLSLGAPKINEENIRSLGFPDANLSAQNMFIMACYSGAQGNSMYQFRMSNTFLCPGMFHFSNYMSSRIEPVYLTG